MKKISRYFVAPGYGDKKLRLLLNRFASLGVGEKLCGGAESWSKNKMYL